MIITYAQYVAWYMADVISGASALQIAKSLETAEFCFRDVPDCDRAQAIFDARSSRSFTDYQDAWPEATSV